MNNVKKGFLIVIFSICFITVAVAQDVTVKLGNNDGSSKFTISNSDSTERIRITDQGNVGIGTSNPSCKLTVENSGQENSLFKCDYNDTIIDFDNDIRTSGILLWNKALNNNQANERTLGINFLVRDVGAGLGFIGFTTNSTFFIAPYSSPGQSGGTYPPKFVVNSNGNVGIGTITPAGTLDVNGTIYQRGSQIHADYVFDPNYKIESVKEHADFMFKEKHLKAVPKAKKDEKGQDIVEYGSHMKGMLEELEKAHVYIAQQNEKILLLSEIESA